MAILRMFSNFAVEKNLHHLLTEEVLHNCYFATLS